MPKVLVTARSFRKMQGEHWRILEEAHCEIIAPQDDNPRKEADMLLLVCEMDALLVGNDAVTANVIAAAPNLRVVSRYGVGLDNIDVPAATRAGVIVTNTPGTNQVAVAELTVGLILSLARKIPHHDAVVKSGAWSRVVGTELAGKTVGVVGLGRIGKEVVLRLKGFGVRFLVYDVYQDAAFATEHDLRFTSLEELLTQSDVVTLHATLTTENQSFIGDKELARMKPSAFLINTARGGLVDENALYRALAENRLAGAAIDAFADEPPKDNPLLKLGDKIICTPHLGAQTHEAVQKMSILAAQNIAQALRGEKPVGLVNPEVYQSRAETFGA